jgi:PKD repeat protein
LHVSEKSKRRLEFSITAVFMLALLLVGAVLIFSGGTASAKEFATLHLFGGRVDVQRNGSDSFERGMENASLHEGDTVRTGEFGRASIEYFDDSVTRLDHDTTFRLVTLETLGNANDSPVIELDQSAGNSFNRVSELTDPDSRFDIDTPSATASVQGTVYALIVENGATTVAVLDGEVKTTGRAGPVSVSAGRMVVVDAGGSVGVVRDITDDLLNSSWLSFNLCDVDHDDRCPNDGSTAEQPPEQHGKQGEPGPRTITTVTPGPGDGPPAPDVNQAPVAGFTASTDAGVAPLLVGFSDDSTDPDGDDLSRHWSFGDGSTQDGGTSPTHSFDDPGSYTVTLTVEDGDGATDSKSKVIEVTPSPPAFDHIVISPSNATIQPGGSQNYSAEAFDTDGDSMGNVTNDTSFSISPNGSCNGNRCTANQPGNHTVTGTYSGDTDDATLVVEEPPPPPCPNYALSFHSRPPSSIDAGRQFNVQVRVDVREGGSNDGPLTISLSLSGGSFSGGDTSATWTGQGTVTFNHLTIDQPGSYSVRATAPCASSSDAAPITVTDDGSNALGLLPVVPGLLAASRGRSRHR